MAAGSHFYPHLFLLFQLGNVTEVIDRIIYITMEQDSNLIFVLKPINDAAKAASKDSHNKEYYAYRESPKVIIDTSRDSTPATNIGDEEEDVDLRDRAPKRRRVDEEKVDKKEDLDAQLRFTFDRKLKNVDQGFVFGSNPKTCDILLGKIDDGVSGSISG